MNVLVSLAQLNFTETVVAGALQALFTATFVAFGAAYVVKRMELRQTERWRDLDAQRAADMRDLDAERADQQRQLGETHDRTQQRHDHEFQTRTALRESYARLLVAQRRSRQASLALATAPGNDRPGMRSEAVNAHDEFIDEYHRLALDADRPMWVELRYLRKALDVLLEFATIGDQSRCEELVESSRSARQNLEGRFRERLGHERLQSQKDIGDLTRPSGMKG